jgi:uncharacterized pyridoxamine 5'-phosphate oxidase family protein
MADKRVQAAEAVVQSIKTGERVASHNAAQWLADDVVLDTGREQVSGKSEVLARVSGVWPFTPIYQQSAWSTPMPEGDTLKVEGVMPAIGAAPAGMNLTFSFSGHKINKIKQEMVMGGPPQEVTEVPAFIKGQITGALANGTPIVVCYVDESGQPKQSLRGSTIVFGPTQLAIWARNAEGGMPNALAKNPRVSLLYRDSKSRSTVIVEGRAHVEKDEEIRRRVYEMTPEVEQLHDTARNGAAIMIDITRLQGGGPRGNFRMQREA